MDRGMKAAELATAADVARSYVFGGSPPLGRRTPGVRAETPGERGDRPRQSVPHACERRRRRGGRPRGDLHHPGVGRAAASHGRRRTHDAGRVPALRRSDDRTHRPLHGGRSSATRSSHARRQDRSARACRAPHPSAASPSPTCCVTSTGSSCPDSRTGSPRTSSPTSRPTPRGRRSSATCSPPASGCRACSGRPALPAPSSRPMCSTGWSTCSDCRSGSGRARPAAASSRTARPAARSPRSSQRASAPAAARSTNTAPATVSPRQRLTVYTSRHAHSSIEKAVKIAGLGRDNLRLVEADGRHGMRVDALQAAIASRSGRRRGPGNGVRDRRHDLFRRRGSGARHRRALPP